MGKIKIFGLYNGSPKAEHFFGELRKAPGGYCFSSFIYRAVVDVIIVKRSHFCDGDVFVFDIVSWCAGDGLRVRIGEYDSRFVTGINAHYQGGGSGTIKNPAELLEFLKQNT